MKIKVAVSNRHVHLTREDLDILYGRGYVLNKRNDLSQDNQFAALESVILKTDKAMISEVRIVGPLRDYTQVEIAKEDSILLGLNPPTRDSGDLENSESITIIGPCGSIFRENCCIIAVNHIHANNDDIKEYANNDIVNVLTQNGKVIRNVHIKKDPNFTLEMHVDTHNAKEYNLENGNIITIEGD